MEPANEIIEVAHENEIKTAVPGCHKHDKHQIDWTK